jgi:tetratricopeptide (TPR) repeat protein
VKALGLCLALLGALTLMPATASAASDEEAFKEATTALQSGAYSIAIERLEQLSDRGLVRASISRNRALAYLQRAESAKRRPGDLGQAVAALRETLLLDPSDSAAERALAEVTQEISRQRARKGLDPVVIEPPLSYAVVALFGVNIWAWATLLGSLALSVGWVLARSATRSPVRLGGQITAASGLLLVLLGAGFSWAAEAQWQNQRPAVVVVPEASLLDAEGAHQTAKALGVDTTSIPEGASVVVTRNNGRLLEVGWGTFRAWVLASQVRVLAR